ncbi:hypothetical protein [Streptococcus sp. S784/96/1]|uniref:hypothetical protein n=1 Tax=Streptococcus sp. S784/96/1 TaxID=2653499 RepID=UPI001386A42E|nr:hypothetical protein [Streptococcus sp. S784/96/1]
MSKRKNSILRRTIERESLYKELLKQRGSHFKSSYKKRNNNNTFREILLKPRNNIRDCIFLKIRSDIDKRSIYFLSNPKTIRHYSNNLNSASIFNRPSLQNIPKKANVKYFVIQIPKEQFLQANDKINYLKTLFPNNHFPDLFNFQNIIQ